MIEGGVKVYVLFLNRPGRKVVVEKKIQEIDGGC